MFLCILSKVSLEMCLHCGGHLPTGLVISRGISLQELWYARNQGAHLIVPLIGTTHRQTFFIAFSITFEADVLFVYVTSENSID